MRFVVFREDLTLADFEQMRRAMIGTCGCCGGTGVHLVTHEFFGGAIVLAVGVRKCTSCFNGIVPIVSLN